MDFRASLCQIQPALGLIDQNLEAHHNWLDKALADNADRDRLILFPELSLCGYFLRDLVPEVAMSLDDPRVRGLVERSKDASIVFGMVEHSRDHRQFNSMVFAEGGEILHVHRKVHLPDYGIFEEGRYFAAGDRFDPVESRLGRFGVLTCEDAWHLSAGWLHFLGGVDALLLPSASPARGIDTDRPELSSQLAWRTLTSALGLFFQTWVLHCNRVGIEDGAMFSGGSMVVGPFGYPECEAQDEEEILCCRIHSAALERARVQSPLLRDAKPELVRLHLARLLADPDALAVRRTDAPPSEDAGE